MAAFLLGHPKSDEAQPKLVKPIRLTDQVCQIIKEQIFNGTLRPGDRVVEQKIARQFGVGQNAVREALIELSHLGFVRRIPNTGTYVTKLTPQDAEKIARIRGSLEGLVVDLISERIAHQNLKLDHADQLLSKMRESVQRGDMVAFYDYDLQFHRTLWSLSDNEYLAQMLEQLVAPLFAFFIMINLHPGARSTLFLEAVSYHERVLQALNSHSPEKARRALQQLLGLSLRQQRDILHDEHADVPESGGSSRTFEKTRRKARP
ncbi:MAG: GntR family transcriptional regulator [Acidobacteriota bacterium]